MSTTDFHADLARSQSPAIHAAIWQAISERMPEALAIIPAHTANDKRGIDYWIELPHCRMEGLDVKIRAQDYLHKDPRTAFIELVANTTTGKPGWTIDPSKQTDWVLFYYADTGRHVLYNARQLRSAVNAHLPYLQSVGKVATTTTGSYNGSYDSSGLIVAHSDLMKCITANSHSKAQAAG